MFSVKIQRGDVARLSRLAEVPYSTVARIVKGGSANPGVHTVRKIEAAIAQLEAERAGKVEQGLGNGSATLGAGEGDQ